MYSRYLHTRQARKSLLFHTSMAMGDVIFIQYFVNNEVQCLYVILQHLITPFPVELYNSLLINYPHYYILIINDERL